MERSSIKLAHDIVNEITSSKITIQKKLLLLELLDKAFKKHFGINNLSN